MKIIVTSTGDTLESEVDLRFGRAEKFILYDTEDGSFSVIENQQNLQALSGAGIQTSKTIIDAGAEAVITPNCGPKAFSVLSSEGIRVFTCKIEKIKDIIADFKNNKLEEIKQANVEGHWI